MKLLDRGYQLGMGLGMKLLPASKQEVLSGAGAILKVPEILAARGLSRPLIVTGPRVSKTDFFQRLEGALTEAGCEPCVFTEVEPDPSTDLIERVALAYRIGGCDSFIALGGGSNMDAAKAAAALLARPEKELTQLGGLMKVRRKIPFMVAIPTTAGTGSECTVAAVVTDSRTHRKFAINDPALCPDAAVLDPDLTEGLPPSVVAATGMDALTHAVEAWLNRPYHKRATAGQCIAAVHDIMMYLPFVYEGSESRARQKLLEASYKAGQAFTVACVGNVHAIAHTLGGLYHIPHGQANAVLLPVILEDYGKTVWKPLARLTRAAGLEHLLGSAGKEQPGGGPAGTTGSDQALAEAFIARIRQMNREMGIPEGFEQIREEDLDQMAEWATKEANPLYPVPVIYHRDDVKRILRKVMK
ncbi:MAG: iron-containing alcohol dehydrogenase [Firmicutes bacterium]|nr:iron-containing alcohol dehydrogenase [Bacillota bacterium]